MSGVQVFVWVALALPRVLACPFLLRRPASNAAASLLGHCRWQRERDGWDQAWGPERNQPKVHSIPGCNKAVA